MAKKDDFLKLLVAKGKVNEAMVLELEKAASLVGKSVEQLVVERKLLDQEELAQLKADIYKLPYANLLDKKVSAQVLKTISREAAENYQIICFDRTAKEIKVGLVDPENFKASEAINFLSKEEKIKASLHIISLASFQKVFKQYSSLAQEITTALEQKAKIESEDTSKLKSLTEEERVDEIMETAPVAKIVSVIVRHAVEGRASDIHIEPFHKESRVRYRIDGILHTSLVLPRSVHAAVIARIKVLASLKLDETRIPQDGRIRLVIDEKPIDFRVSTLPLLGDEKVVMRILDISKGAPTLEELGYGGTALKIIKNNIKKTTGMMLVTGPTGSGKSTTLFSLLNLMNQEGVNISTLEDPVEYFIKGVNQSQIRPEIGFGFANGLRSLLRQDPDIIMVGEIRDNETAELAIHASLTGHFLLSTLHTNNALGAIPRLIDMKVERFLLGSTLNLIIGQRLVRKICPYCKVSIEVPKEIEEEINIELSRLPIKIKEIEFANKELEQYAFYRGQGCPRCANTGYSGRIAISEVVEINDALKKIVFEDNKNIIEKDLIATQDFVSMKQDGIIKVIKGITTYEEVLRVIRD
jgi:type IV pilus assembly protein PilB